jgi:hypothetical protein
MKSIERKELPRSARSAQIIETADGRIIVSRIKPIVDQRYCLEIHQETMSRDGNGFRVVFLLLSEEERAALADALGEVRKD